MKYSKKNAFVLIVVLKIWQIATKFAQKPINIENQMLYYTKRVEGRSVYTHKTWHAYTHGAACITATQHI